MVGQATWETKGEEGGELQGATCAAEVDASKKKPHKNENADHPLLRLILPTVVDALFQRCTEGEGRVAKTVKGAGCVLTPPILTVEGVLALIHICKGHHRRWLQ